MWQYVTAIDNARVQYIILLHIIISVLQTSFLVQWDRSGVFLAYRQPSVVGDDGWFVDKWPVGNYNYALPPFSQSW